MSLTLDACVGFMVALDTILIANERSTSGRCLLSYPLLFWCFRLYPRIPFLGLGHPSHTSLHCISHHTSHHLLHPLTLLLDFTFKLILDVTLILYLNSLYTYSYSLSVPLLLLNPLSTPIAPTPSSPLPPTGVVSVNNSLALSPISSHVLCAIFKSFTELCQCFGELIRTTR